MTVISLKEVREKGLCPNCWGRGIVEYTSEDDISIDDALLGVMMANAVMRYKTCPTCNGKGKIHKNDNR